MCAGRRRLHARRRETTALLTGRRPRRLVVGTAALVGALAYAGLVVAAGIPARPEPDSRRLRRTRNGLPAITVVDSGGVAGYRPGALRETIARDVVVDLRAESDALRTRDLDRAATAASGAWLASLWTQIRAASAQTTVGAATTSIACR